MIKHSVLAAILAGLLGQAHAADDGGVFCDLTSIPDDAGYTEWIFHTAARVYPLAKEITSSFTGCQSLWSTEDNKNVLVMKFQFLNGKPRSLVMQDRTFSFENCSSEPELSKPGELCSLKNGLPLKSYPKECLLTSNPGSSSSAVSLDPRCESTGKK